jgi:2-polyprenyl-3-methyl-5-hydroxy-6-metoxy-1,4-benzoquinol methylase
MANSNILKIPLNKYGSKSNFSQKTKIRGYLLRRFSRSFLSEIQDIISNEVLYKPQSTYRILDIGSGAGEYWINSPLNQISKMTNIEIVFFDASQEWLDLGNFNPTKKITGIAPRDLESIGDAKFDFVIALDFIEHLSKSDGYKFLYECERITRGYVAILTPNGFIWQPPSLDNPFNAHISGWTPKEFKKFGYTQITGHTGFKWFVGPYAQTKLFRRKIINRCVVFLNLFTYRFPNYSFHFLAIQSKNMEIL